MIQIYHTTLAAAIHKQNCLCYYFFFLFSGLPLFFSFSIHIFHHSFIFSLYLSYIALCHFCNFLSAPSLKSFSLFFFSSYVQKKQKIPPHLPNFRILEKMITYPPPPLMVQPIKFWFEIITTNCVSPCIHHASVFGWWRKKRRSIRFPCVKTHTLSLQYRDVKTCQKCTLKSQSNFHFRWQVRMVEFFFIWGKRERERVIIIQVRI